MDSITRPRASWFPLLQIALLLGLLALLYFPTVHALFQRWTQWDEGLSHGLPTVAIFLFLIWRSQPWPYRQDERWLRVFLLTGLFFVSIAWFLLDKINIEILATLSLLPLLILFIASSYSSATALHLLVPVGVLIFAIPVWGYFTDVLVGLSAYVVGLMGRFVDIAILIDGNNIFIPSGRLYIDDGCSGLRYLVIGLLMAYLVSCINNYRIKRALIALTIACLLGLLTNWIRIFALVMIGYYTEMQSSLMHDHETFGWILFSLVMMPSIYFAPVYKRKIDDAEKASPPVRPLWALAALSSGPILSLFSNTLVHEPPTVNLDAIAIYSSGVKATELIDLTFPEDGVRENQTYEIDGVILDVNLVHYPQKNTTDKLVPYFNRLYDKSDWVLVEEKSVAELSKKSARISLFKRVNSLQHLVLLHRYEVGEYATSSYEKAKLLQLPASLLGQNYFNIFTVQAACAEPNCEQALSSVTRLAETWIGSTKISSQKP